MNLCIWLDLHRAKYTHTHTHTHTHAHTHTHTHTTIYETGKIESRSKDYIHINFLGLILYYDNGGGHHEVTG